MILSNITDRGTLRGIIYRGAGSGTDDYTQLSNKPQINGNELVGNKSGHDLGLANTSDIPSVPTIEINKAGALPSTILKTLHLNGEGYSTYFQPFSGADSNNDGKLGLVPPPHSASSDFNKFLKGNGQWASPYYDYKTIEEYTGEKWIDDTPVYRKVFDFSSSPFQLTRNAWTAIPAVYIDNINTVLEITMTGYDTSSVYPATDQGCSKRFINGTLNYFLNIDFRIFVTAVIVKYTKHA